MTDKKLTGISLTKHYDDGSTEAWAKVPAPAVGAILAAGLATAPVGGRGSGSKYNYLNADACPVHGPWKAVQAGVSKSTGRSYDAFWTCDTAQGEERCVNKPSREWVETHPPHMASGGGFDQAPTPEPTGTPSSSASDFDSLPF